MTKQEKFGKIFSKLRFDKFKTQTACAEALGITKQAVSNIEKGKRKLMDPFWLSECSEKFKVDLFAEITKIHEETK